MSNRNGLGFLVVSVVGIVFIVTLLAAFPISGYVEEEVAAKEEPQPARFYQKSDPTLLVPESTMGVKPAQYIHNWDDNPVATIPESTVGRYSHNWDANPVATIPESTIGK